MKPSTFKERLESLIASSGVPLALLTPNAGLEVMLRLYRDDAAGGSLSCAWGVVTRYGEEEFGFAITRAYPPSPDDSVAFMHPSLSLVFKIGPRAMAGDFPGWMGWCDDPEEMTEFRSTIHGHPPFQFWGSSRSAGVAVVCHDEESAHALFDCWGVRDPSRPAVRMTEEEWSRTDDVSLMLRWFRQEWRGDEADLDSLLQRYCLACCRRIWQLLPQAESRSGVEVAERFLDGLATRDELARAEWLAEGAAFKIDHNSEPESIARWSEAVLRIPAEKLAAMVHSVRPGDDLSPRGLLEHAAYFADLAMCYPGIRPKESIERYRLFLPAPLLREVVGNPFRVSCDRPPG